MPADYDGDGQTDFAVFRPSTGVWGIDRSTLIMAFGLNGDIPVPADYDGDGKADVAIFETGSDGTTEATAARYASINGDGGYPETFLSRHKLYNARF